MAGEMLSPGDRGPFRVGLITVSDSAARGEREDGTGPVLAEMLTQAGFVVQERAVVLDEAERISAVLIEMADEKNLNLLITAGGTGLAPTDQTPEATQTVIDRVVPGLAEAMRQAGLKKTPHAALSRGLAGTRGACLIVNLPGSPKAAAESLAVILPALPHGLEKLAGDPTPCGG